MAAEGWVKLYRCLFEKAIWLNSTPEQKVVLITLLGAANHSGREWEWKGKQFKAKPGMLVTSLESLSTKCGKGISVQNVRGALKKFEKYEFLTQEVTKTGRLITLVNWGLYQVGESEGNKDTNKDPTDDEQRPNKEVTKSQQRGNKEPTTNKNDKNNKNENNDREMEEGKEEIPQFPPLSYPTPFHEKIFNQCGEVSYKTWFTATEIEDKDSEIVIKANSDFMVDIINQKFKESLDILFGKSVSIILRE